MAKNVLFLGQKPENSTKIWVRTLVFIVLLQVSKPQIIVYYSLDNMKVKSTFEFLPNDRSSVPTTKLLLQNQL